MEARIYLRTSEGEKTLEETGKDSILWQRAAEV